MVIELIIDSFNPNITATMVIFQIPMIMFLVLQIIKVIHSKNMLPKLTNLNPITLTLFWSMVERVHLA